MNTKKYQGVNFKLMNNYNKQTGLSLIELLISMFIGLFLLVGITTTYLSSKKNSIVRTQTSMLEDNGRIAIEIINNTLQHAGYTSNTGGVIDKKFINEDDDVKNTTCGDSSVVNTNFPEVVTKDGIASGTNFEPDSLGVIYLGDDSVFTDCTGEELPASCRVGSGAATNSAKIYSAFYIDNASNLRCVGSRDADEEVIAEGIENMQILYGLDRNGDSQVDSYVNASAVDGVGVNGAWTDVISIKLAVLVRSLVEVKQKAEAETFTLLDTAYTVPTADRFQREVFSSTISIRNSLN